jgi:hypothetical protein
MLFYKLSAGLAVFPQLIETCQIAIREKTSGHAVDRVVSAERLDRACHKALDAGDPSYRTVKGILATA